MSETGVVGKMKTYILCPKTFFFPEKRAVYEITWKNVVEPNRPQVIQYAACAIRAG
jgi:hypothetical protein